MSNIEHTKWQVSLLIYSRISSLKYFEIFCKGVVDLFS